jgi:hypothetical protein
MLKLGERERRVRGGSVGAAPFYMGRRVVQGDCGRQVKEGELSPLNENQYRARRRRGGRINRGNEGGFDRCGFPPWHCGAWGGGDSRGGPRWKKGGGCHPGGSAGHMGHASRLADGPNPRIRILSEL